jgi:endonuclease/exonuclease/phosphatase family metal-dependent hydrolase
MKRIFFIISFVCMFVAAAPAGAVKKGEPVTLKLMTYNLRFGELATMQQIGEYIASESPDIIALQECDWATNRKRAPHQNGVKFVNELAYYTGMFGIYGKSINYAGGYYGIGILSKYPILKYERVLLPNDGRTEQRSMLVADIELPDGRIITYVNTHLEVMTAEMRIEQAKFINEYLLGCKNQIFLSGDMNAIPDSEEMEYLRKNWKDLTDKVFTYHTAKPEMKIDYIYTRPAKNVELLNTEVKEGIRLSDHFPVISTIVLR